MVARVAVASSGCAATPVGAVDGKVPSRFVGEPLAVLNGAGAATAAGTAATREYVVQPGDTLWSLARRFGTNVDQLMAHNSLSSAQELRAGVSLRVPGGSSLQKRPTAVDTTRTSEATASLRPRPGGKVGKAGSRRYALVWPVDGVITSRYGKRSGKHHDGIDIGAPKGTNVRAANAGRVLFAAKQGGYGNLVLLKHADGLVTVYAHHDRNLVRKGQWVKAGQVIATVGTTGRSSGPHLHFEVRKGVKPQNPLKFLPP